MLGIDEAIVVMQRMIGWLALMPMLTLGADAYDDLSVSMDDDWIYIQDC